LSFQRTIISKFLKKSRIKKYRKVYISIDIHKKMEQKQENNPFARSPTLGTVLMIEKFIDENSGEYKVRELWQKLPKKVMWQTYLVVIDYLQNINKITLDRNGTVGYIWNPSLAEKLKLRKNY
jgi:hypothetical protein